jgi:hypothetical protein
MRARRELRTILPAQRLFLLDRHLEHPPLQSTFKRRISNM